MGFTFGFAPPQIIEAETWADERRRPASRQLAVEGKRAPALGEHAEVCADVEVGEQSVPREEIAVAVLGLGVAEEELPSSTSPRLNRAADPI